MAQKGVELDRETISCSICLDLLKDPVALTCGHSYCMDCIKVHWDQEDRKRIYSCPQCRQAFTPRPVLKKNVLLADLVEKLKTNGVQAAAADHCYAGAEDVACDVCTGRKLKAFKSCLVCQASFCEKHLQPHYDSPPFQKHQLVEPSKKHREKICSHRDEMKVIFCRTDQQLICYLCSLDEHKGHETVPAEAQMTKKQKQVEVSRQNIRQRIQEREKLVELLQQQVKDIRCSADKAMSDGEEMLTQMIHLLQDRIRDMKQQIRSQQETEVRGVKELEKKLEQEIRELKRKDAELEQLSLTEDHIQFLHNYPSVSALTSSINIRPLRRFEEVTAAVSQLRDQLQDIVRDTWTNISLTATQLDVSLSDPQAEPKTRAGFLKYSRQLTLDPNTANPQLLLSEGNRKVTVMKQQQSHPPHPDRFIRWYQVLSRESLTGRCYWEVERKGAVSIALAYKNISRTGGWNECGFGRNNKSWALSCSPSSNAFWHDNNQTTVSAPQSSRVGVYLDHSAGILSFYSVSETMTLLHRVQTTFTQQIHAGLWIGSVGTSAELCKLK